MKKGTSQNKFSISLIILSIFLIIMIILNINSLTGNITQTKQVQNSQDIFLFFKQNNILEIDKPLGSVASSINENMFKQLKSGTITTSEGVTAYHQYLTFNDSSKFNSSKVVLESDESGNVNTFFRALTDNPLFTWTMDFSSGAASSITLGKLVNLHDRIINVLGAEYVIVDTIFDTKTNGAAIMLLGGLYPKDLELKSKNKFNIGDKTYDVEVEAVSEAENALLLNVNGKSIKIHPGELHFIGGILIGIRDVIYTSKEEQKLLTRVFLGGNKIVLKDSNSADDEFTQNGLSVDNQLIQGGDVKLKAELNADKTKAKIYRISYQYRPQEDIFAPPGTSVRSYSRRQGAFLTPSWDIKYLGLKNSKTTTIAVEPSGRDEYKLLFQNQRGIYYKMPLISTRQDGTLRWGEFSGGVQKNLVWRENDIVNTGDYVVFSNSRGSTDNSALSHILQLENIDNTNKIISFKDLGTGTKQTIYDASNKASLSLDGVSYSIQVNNPTNNPTLSVDVNGDGSIGSATATIVAQGGLTITFNDAKKIVLTTLAKQFSEKRESKVITLPFSVVGGAIRMRRTDITGVDFLFTKSGRFAAGMTNYGDLYQLTDSGDNNYPETLKIQYPMGQRVPVVVITSGI